MEPSILIKAEQIIASRRLKAEELAKKHFDDVIIKSPIVEKVTKELRRSNVLVAQQVIKNQLTNDDAIKEQIDKTLKTEQVISRELELLNLPNNYLKPNYCCSICNDTGHCDGVKCSCLYELIRLLQIKILSCEIPIKTSTFDTFSLSYYAKESLAKMTNILKFCKAYAKDFTDKSTSILMTGGTGLGKTHLALAIINVAISKGYEVKYKSAIELFSVLQNEYYGKDIEMGSSLDSLNRVELLVIDDIGMEIDNQLNTSMLYSIINTRQNASRPTIILTGLSLKEIQTRYNSRIVSRLVGFYKTLTFVGQDVRIQKAMMAD